MNSKYEIIPGRGEIERRAGIKTLYSCKPGEKVAVRDDGDIIVVHQDHKPKIIDAAGNETEIEMDPAVAFATVTNWRGF